MEHPVYDFGVPCDSLNHGLRVLKNQLTVLNLGTELQ
jgi:hypothetical protein